LSALEIDVRGRVGAWRIDARLSVPPGPLVLTGPNGAGKSSVLRMVLGLLRPEAGRIAVGQRVLFDAEAATDLAPELRKLGYVPQHYALFPHLSVLDNVAFGLYGTRRRERGLEVLESLELGHLAQRSTTGLSGGERQRVALARAVAPGPDALLLDEPLAALDAGARRQVREFLRERLFAMPIPALVVTHDPADAAALGERLAVLEAGRVVQQGTLAELHAAPATPFVTQFLAS
jgi:molybdate transport system ATP-binding protein